MPEKVKVKEIGQTLTGFAFDSTKFSDTEGFPIIRIRDLKTNSTQTFFKGQFDKRYVVNKGDLLIGMDGEFNLVEWSNEDALLNQRVCKLIIDEKKADKTYIKYALPKKLKEIENATPFVTVKHLSNKQVLDAEIPLPPKKDQKEIAQLLEEADIARQKRKAANALTDQFLQSAFLSMFGDPTLNEQKWRVKKLDQCVTMKGGGTPNTKIAEYYDGNIPWVSPKDMKSRFINTSIDKITEKAIKESSTKLIEANNVLLVVRSGILKKTLPIGINVVPVAINQDMKALSCEKYLNPYFLAYLLEKLTPQILQNVRGTTADNLNSDVLRNLDIILPPIDLQHKFASIVADTEQLRQKQKQNEIELENLFQALLQKYFG